MNFRKVSTSLLAISACLALAAPSVADDEKEIKFGTLAPKSSPWGKVFQIWVDMISEKSQGSLKLVFYYNGVQGDEKTMVVEKMMAGSQLDGVAVTSVGLSKIWQPILALQTPGLFREWKSLDAARKAINDKAVAGFAGKGIYNLGWGDVGIAHLMSKFDVGGPETLNGHKPYFWKDDPIAPHFFAALKEVASETNGGFSLAEQGLQIPEVLPALNQGNVDFINAPSLAAQQLQWADKLTHIVTQPSGIGIGALVIKQSTLDGLTEDQKKLLKDTGAVAAADLTGRIRKADKHAFDKMKKDKKAIDLSDDDKAKWEKVFKKTQEKVKAIFPADVLDTIHANK